MRYLALALLLAACGGPTEPGSCPPNYAWEVAAVEIHHHEGVYTDTIHIFISACVTPSDSVRDLRPWTE